MNPSQRRRMSRIGVYPRPATNSPPLRRGHTPRSPGCHSTQRRRSSPSRSRAAISASITGAASLALYRAPGCCPPQLARASVAACRPNQSASPSPSSFQIAGKTCTTRGRPLGRDRVPCQPFPLRFAAALHESPRSQHAPTAAASNPLQTRVRQTSPKMKYSTASVTGSGADSRRGRIAPPHASRYRSPADPYRKMQTHHSAAGIPARLGAPPFLRIALAAATTQASKTGARRLHRLAACHGTMPQRCASSPAAPTSASGRQHGAPDRALPSLRCAVWNSRCASFTRVGDFVLMLRQLSRYATNAPP